MEQSFDMSEFESIGFSSEVREKGKLKEFDVIPDEWYLGKITKFFPIKSIYEGKPRNQLQFYVEFQDKEFSFSSDTATYQLRATAKYGIPTKQTEDEKVVFKPIYKLWTEFIAKIYNVEDEEFDSLLNQHGGFAGLVNSLIGRKIYFMVEINKSKNGKGEDKTYYNIVRIKYSQDQNKPEIVTPVETVKPQQSTPVVTPVKPAELKSIKDVVKPKVEKAVAKGTESSLSDMQNFEVNPTNSKHADEDVFKDLNLS